MVFVVRCFDPDKYLVKTDTDLISFASNTPNTKVDKINLLQSVALPLLFLFLKLFLPQPRANYADFCQYITDPLADLKLKTWAVRT